MLRILGREAVNERFLGTFFKSVAQPVILFGYEKQVMNPHIIQTLVGF